MPQAIHFISIGGSVMHNLAIALQQQGHTITGSDDEITDPSRTRLQQHGLLPTAMGWFPEKIHPGLQAVILGMHARQDNPELIKAQKLGVPVYAYPDCVYKQSQQKQRIVIAGSHGKTTITAMILHALKYHNRRFDYVIGTLIDGFETTVRLTPDGQGTGAPFVIIEGDEYASSPIDSRAKFLHYQPHIALISGIAWDHVGLYPTWDEYVDPFESLAEAMPKAGILVFDESDDMLDVIGQKERDDITKIPYKAHASERVNGQTCLITKGSGKVPVQIFGDHNMKNIAGAIIVCDRIGLTEDQFYEAIPTFKGVPGRLEQVAGSPPRRVFLDAARTPAQVEAVTEAVKRQFPDQRLLAILEVSPASRQNPDFLEQYQGCLNATNMSVIYCHEPAQDPSGVDHAHALVAAFGRDDLPVFTDSAALRNYLIQQRAMADIFLFMSSDSFGHTDLKALVAELL